MRTPPFFPVAERRPKGKQRRSLIQPPARAIGKPHRAVPGDRQLAFHQPRNLIGNAPRRRPVIIVPVTNNLSRCAIAPEIPPLADLRRAFEFEQPDGIIGRNQISYALAVRQDQQLPVRVGLGLEALDRFREPASPVPGQTQARDEAPESGAARPPRELPVQLPWFRRSRAAVPLYGPIPLSRAALRDRHGSRIPVLP
jgi:hypothetical protein